MDKNELLEEIRLNRKEIQQLHKEFYVFKGKAFGFISLLSILLNIALNFITKKFHL